MLKPVEVDAELLESARMPNRSESDRDVVERGLRALSVERRRLQREALEGLWGIGWEGDLDEMRRDKPRRPID